MASSLTEKVLELVIERWREEFVGISAVEIARRLDASHEQILEASNLLVGRGEVHTRAATLGGWSLVLTEAGVKQQDDADIDTVIVFPERKVLRRGLKRLAENFGPYSGLLHAGAGQLGMRYFRASVLNDYREQQERYYMHDDVTGGRVGVSSQFYHKLVEEGQENHGWSDVRYGKCRMLDGNLAIGVILWDLHKLPRQEQVRWSGYEIVGGLLDRSDPNWVTFVRMNFDGEWLDADDPLADIQQLIATLSKEYGIYRIVRNPDLLYPVLNNRKGYRDAHKELEKILIAALQVKPIEALLDQLTPPIPMPRDGNNRPLTVTALNALIERLSREDVDLVIEPLRVCQRVRNETHVIDEKALETEDYHSRFLEDCRAIAAALARLEAILAAQHVAKPLTQGGAHDHDHR